MKKYLSLCILPLALAAACKSKPKTSEPVIKPVEQPANPESNNNTVPTAPKEDNAARTLNSTDFTTAEEYNRSQVLKPIHFEADSAELLPSVTARLDANIAWLKEHPQFNLLIEGNCDERNTDQYNLALGQQRADQVKSYLTNHGIFSSRVKTISYGEDQPVDAASNEEAWAKNRRAELKLMAK